MEWIKSRLQGNSKVNQNNFWEKWFKMEIKDSENNKDKIISTICDYMIELELDKHFIKNVMQGIAENQFGKDSVKLGSITENILEKIKQAKYLRATLTKI